MTRYFFHVKDGTTVLDAEGFEFPTLKAAREEAIRACGDMLRDLPSTVTNGDPFRLWVTDQPSGHGNTIFTLTVTAKSG
jgi:hypothetical protein